MVSGLTGRIVFFVSGMGVGGAERVAAQLCNQWAKAGCSVALVITYSKRGEIRYSLDDRVRVVRLSDMVVRPGWPVVGALSRLRSMRRVIRNFEANAVVSFFPRINIASILVALGTGTTVVVSERAFPPAVPLSRLLGRLRRLIYPLADCVVMQTNEGERWLRDAIPAARGRVIPNPCEYPLNRNDPVVKPEQTLSSQSRCILASGRLVEQKGFRTLIKVFASLSTRYTGWSLVILGDGDQKEELVQIGREHGVFHSLFLPGNVGNPGDWYERADLFVLSSSFEGFPNVLVEAMAYGVPPVSFDCPTGPADIITSGENGILVDLAQGSAALERAIERLMSDEDLRLRLGRQATQVRETYAPGRIARKWLEVLSLEHTKEQ